MKTFFRLCLALLSLPATVSSQTNMLFTHPAAEAVLLGNYNPADYAASMQIIDPQTIANDVAASVSPTKLREYIVRLSEFGNRNTGSDTSSATFGIGAARRWVHAEFEKISAENEGRLIPCYFQFDQVICSVGQHRNICAILPGSDPTRNGVVLIEGHIDSRCAVLCDPNCRAEGVEDNATGTALVMELARTMSKFTFKNTLVFVATIGEEQGLVGAEAMAIFFKNKNIPLRAVLNNDVIGGILCGETSSPPSCPGLNNVDSTSVRLFSSGNFNSKHKQLARFIKLQYRENLLPAAQVPMNVRIMSPEDRTGRGGDHIPFREQGFPAMRFTAANEHGDASNGPGYDDRQHTSDDVLGVDTDGDAVVDSFFVDFNYLARNAVLNGNATAMAAIGVPTPTNFTAVRAGNQLTVSIEDPAATGDYRVAVRTTTHDWDTVYTLVGVTSATLGLPSTSTPIISVAAVNADGVESLFSIEKFAGTVSAPEVPEDEAGRNIRLFQNRPNPFDEATWISFWVNELPAYREAVVQIADLQGKTIERLPVALRQGMNEVMYTHGYGVRGAFVYALMIDGKTVDARQMIFAN